MPKIRYKTERNKADEPVYKRTQVDMTDEMRDKLDRIARRKGIQHRAELIRMYLVAAIEKDEKSESTKNSVSGRPNDRSRAKRRAS